MGFTFFHSAAGPGRNFSFCQFLPHWLVYETLYSLLSKAAYLSVMREIKTRRIGLSKGLTVSARVSQDLLNDAGEQFFFPPQTKALIYRGGPSLCQPIEINSVIEAFIEGLWGFLPEDREKSSSCIQVPSTSYKNGGERSLIYGVAWLHFTAVWH